MNYLLLVLGILVFVGTIWDLINTTFSPDGAGFVTMIITKAVYDFFRKICLKFKWMKLFERVGIIIIVTIIMFWYLSIWLGSSLIFCSDPTSIVNSETREYASTSEQIYYAGFTLTTLGIGDFNATTTGWRFFTVILSLTGFILITTGISYMVPALSAVVEKRRLGSYISVLGNNPQQILVNQWGDEGFSTLESHVNKITEMIIEHNQRLLAYPVIYCFYTTNTTKAIILNIARLDEALSIMLKLVRKDQRPPAQNILPLRNAISDFIAIHQKSFIELQTEEPTLPEVIQLIDAGIPLQYDEQSLPEIYSDISERRTQLHSLLKEQGRDFSNVYKE